MINFTCIFSVDEAQVLHQHLGDMIISRMDKEHLINGNSKRGTLSVLLFAITHGQYAEKIVFAGTSSELRYIDNFGTYETKPVDPFILNNFTAWNSDQAVSFVGSLVDINPDTLKSILVDYYRPRTLENFVYDLFSISVNDKASPETQRKRYNQKDKFLDIDSVLRESYDAVIYRFTSVSIKPIAKRIKDAFQSDILLKLLLSSMMTSEDEPLTCELTDDQKQFFTDTVGALYLIPGSHKGYSFYEGYVIDSLLILFENEINESKSLSSLKLLKDIIKSESKKTSAKGVSFEAVVVSDLIHQKGPFLIDILKKFEVDTSSLYILNNLQLPTENSLYDEIKMPPLPLNSFIRPSKQFRPDILSFLTSKICLSIGIKLYTGEIPLKVHLENLASTDPDEFFFKNGKSTNSSKRNLWKKRLRDNPLDVSIRFVIDLPGICGGNCPKNTVLTHKRKDVIVFVNNKNMRNLLSEEVSRLVEYITAP